MLSFFTPLVVLTVSFLMIPPLVLYGTVGPKPFVFFCGVPFVLLLLMLQGLAVPLIIVGLFFIIPAVVMGELYRRNHTAMRVVLTGTFVIVAEMLLALIGSYAFQYDVIYEMRMMMWESYDQFPDMIKSEIDRDLIELSIMLMTKSIPFFMITVSVYYVAIAHTLSSRILRYYKVPAQAFPPIRQWMVPKSLVFYYIIVLILDMFIDPSSFDSFLTTVVYNVLPLLTLVFMVQAISFIMFLIHHKKKTKIWLPVLSIITFILFPTIASVLGVMDAMFPIRKRLKAGS